MKQILTIMDGMIESYELSDPSKVAQMPKTCTSYACDGWTVAITNETDGRFLRLYHPRISDSGQVCAKHFRLRDGVLTLVCEPESGILSANFVEKEEALVPQKPIVRTQKVIIRDLGLNLAMAR